MALTGRLEVDMSNNDDDVHGPNQHSPEAASYCLVVFVHNTLSLFVFSLYCYVIVTQPEQLEPKGQMLFCE